MEKDKTIDQLLRISQEIGIPVKKVFDLLFYLQSSDLIDNNALLKSLGVSRNVLNQVKQKLGEILKPMSSVTALSTKGRKMVDLVITTDYLEEEGILKFLENQKYRQALKFLKENIIDHKPLREFDQFTATIETTAHRAVLMNFFQDLNGKRLLFLGDDDSTSLAVSYIDRPERSVVLDIDNRILEGIATVANNNNFSIETNLYDARKSLPELLANKFDVVFTDPPYTENGFRLFLSRAITALDKSNLAARVYICYGNSDRAKERFLPIHEILNTSGMMSRWIFDKFNRYEGAESIGSASSLIICDTTPKTRSQTEGNFNEEIYTG